MTDSTNLSKRSLNALAPAMTVEERAHDDVRRLGKLAATINKNMVAAAERQEARMKTLLSKPKNQRTIAEEEVLQSMACSEIMRDLGLLGSFLPSQTGSEQKDSANARI